MHRQRVFSGVPGEASVGYCRALKTGNQIFVTDISRWPEFGKAHGELFADHPPTTTMVEVTSLADPDLLIEIEADAVVGP